MNQELYALSKDRSASAVLAFLDRFAPGRVPASVDYPVPAYGPVTTVTFETDREIMDYLQVHQHQPYNLYWNNFPPDSVATAMVFYTRDGAVILGLAVDPEEAKARLAELAAFAKTKYFAFGWGAPPPRHVG